jgi:hypothetical protein
LVEILVPHAKMEIPALRIFRLQLVRPLRLSFSFSGSGLMSLFLVQFPNTAPGQGWEPAICLSFSQQGETPGFLYRTHED